MVVSPFVFFGEVVLTGLAFLAGDKNGEINVTERDGEREIRMPESYVWRERETTIMPFYT